MNPEIAVLIGVKLMCSQLTDDELTGLNSITIFGGNPKAQSWYKKVSALFTEDNGERMHRDVRRALDDVIFERFGGTVKL